MATPVPLVKTPGRRDTFNADAVPPRNTNFIRAFIGNSENETEWLLPTDGRSIAIVTYSGVTGPVNVTLHTFPTANLGRGASADEVMSIDRDDHIVIGPLERNGFEDPANPGFAKITLSATNESHITGFTA